MAIRHALPMAALLAGSLLLSACESTTASGAVGANRKQLLLVSTQEVNAASAQSYRQQLVKARQAGVLNRDARQARRVNAVAQRLIAEVGVFRPEARGWQWEVNVFASPELNAYCMPGGKIGVYSGLIDRLSLTDAELAAVISHEIAHALREHSREQVSQEFAKQQGIALAGAVLGLDAGTQDLVQLVGQYSLSLPFSRRMEKEADLMGLELMARAGYDPNAALSIWRKMEAAGGSGGPEWMSTHPSGTSRIAEMQQMLPQVMPYYRAARP
ncbi:M48 family metallopeptidase [Crenobacter intestini]|uniref:M48 family metallopeptidase n=1 Tax=Crenobacter intestini TaxID=2563443 RepID=A0A4T0UP87_9NEIS|nr:M48 family metallopeptidase [Crenobacter intestini]TIC80582.1 M48 family metallopeptidase [Crenobacter intestini]